jgi:iron complex outermembrane receptor protein
MIARLALLSGSALLALAASPALAQDAPPAPAAEPGRAVPPAPADRPQAPEPSAAEPPAEAGGGDIVVTARRRNESLQDVPLAVSVVGDERLASTASFNVSRLSQIQPSLQFYSTNPRNSAANIRGLGAPFGLTNDGIEQGVGVYVDQVYYSRIASTTFDFLDVERVEVLRGPQGTLYGKNTTAGAINLISRPPSFEPEGRAELSIGNLGYVQARASLSGPLIADTLAIRVAGSATRRRGTIFNLTSGNWVNALENTGVRGALLWRATPHLNVTLSGDYSFQNPECCAQIYVRTGATQRPLNRQYAALAAAFGYAPPSVDPFDRLTDLDSDLRARQQLGGVSLRAEWQIGPGTLTSITAWRHWNWKPSNDRDFIGLPITTVSANPSQQDQWTQELRYAGTVGPLDFVVGAFGFDQSLHTEGRQVQGPAASRWLLNPGNVPAGSAACNPPTANACNPAVLNGLTSINDIDFSNTSLATFGQFTWHVTDRLSLQPGIRLNYDRKSGAYAAVVTTGTGSTILNSDQRGVLAPQSYSPRFSDWNLSWDFTASYRVARDVLLYATYARAFKSGGINLSGLPLDAGNNPILSAATVRPERVNHYEVGLKTQFWNRRLTFNLAGFWSDVFDYQATVTNGQLGVLRGYLANAGLVRVRGVEVEFSGRPTNHLNFYFNGAYTDGRYVRFVDAPCPPELSGGATATAGQIPSAPGTPGGISPANCNISGQWLPGISRWSASYGLEYVLPHRLFGMDGDVVLGFDGSARTKFSSNPSRSLYTDVNGYSLSNFRLGFRAENGWDVTLWLRNAFDAHYFEVLALQSGNTGLVVGQPGDPRTWGVTIRTQF